MKKTRVKHDVRQDPLAIAVFQKKILSWYRKNGRHDLPWRPPQLSVRRDGSVDPYKILVSEVMLQQTQVDRVIPKFLSFMKIFPTPVALAGAGVRELLAEWKGLGYNRRALYLQRAAQKIAGEFKGVFPRDPACIETLPGVGHYTARAVSAFAFDAPHAFIETNIRRIFLHFFFPGKDSVPDEQILPLVDKSIWKRSPRVWYSALMDYGALAMRGIDNPNRRGKHYTRQSRFEGSRRYARAKVLDFIRISKKPLTRRAIHAYMQCDPLLSPYQSEEAFFAILISLEADGFLMISRDGSKIAIRC